MRLSPPDGFDPRLELFATLLVNEGRPGEAVKILEGLADLPDRNTRADATVRSTILRNLARAYLAAGDSEGAESAFARAVRVLEDSGRHASAGDVRLEWARHLEGTGDIDSAREVFEGAAKAADQKPRDASLQCLEAYVKFLRSHGSAAGIPRVEAILQRARSHTPRLDESPLNP
jgi:tetratricopeptide (TPR) repeat protein